ncbi:MAG: hypothetical protein R3C99_26805 [Pirellulaceae bacterium]
MPSVVPRREFLACVKAIGSISLLSGSGGWSKGGDSSQSVQLYNLAEDLGETKNLAAEQPERVAEMQALLERLIRQGRSTPGKTNPTMFACDVFRRPRSLRRRPQQLTA